MNVEGQTMDQDEGAVAANESQEAEAASALPELMTATEAALHDPDVMSGVCELIGDLPTLWSYMRTCQVWRAVALRPDSRHWRRCSHGVFRAMQGNVHFASDTGRRRSTVRTHVVDTLLSTLGISGPSSDGPQWGCEAIAK